MEFTWPGPVVGLTMCIIIMKNLITIHQLELMVKFAAYVPELVASSIETVYFYNPNMAFKQCAGRLTSAIRIFSHIKVTNGIINTLFVH